MIVRLVAAAASGWALSLAYQPTGWWWLAAPCIAVLLVSCYRLRPLRAFWLGLVFGAALYLPLLDWLSVVIGTDAGIGLSIYSALWLGLAAVAAALVSRLRWWWLWAACAWVGLEAVGGRIPFGGWGWGRTGFSQDTAPLLPWAAVAGVPALSFAVVLTAGVLAEIGRRVGLRLLQARRQDAPMAASAAAASEPSLAHEEPPVAGPSTEGPVRSSSAGNEVAAMAVALALVWIAPLLIPVPTAAQTEAGPATSSIGLVQGNVPEPGLDFNSRRREVLEYHVRGTIELAAEVDEGAWPAPDAVLWPENASDVDPFRDAQARAAIDAAAAAVGVPLLVGAVVVNPDNEQELFNQGIVWDPDTGPGQTYTKQNLVPFGEYVPFRGVLGGLISRFDRVPRDFVAVDSSGALDLGATTIGDAICFDVAYDDALRRATRDGGRMLVVQTNNATYNGTSQPLQQFAMSRIRAVEHGRAVAVVSTSGLSGVIAPDGTVVPGTEIGELVAGRYVVEIPQRDDLTVADRVGSVPEWLLALAGLVAFLVAWRRGPQLRQARRAPRWRGRGSTGEAGEAAQA